MSRVAPRALRARSTHTVTFFRAKQLDIHKADSHTKLFTVQDSSDTIDM